MLVYKEFEKMFMLYSFYPLNCIALLIASKTILNRKSCHFHDLVPNQTVSIHSLRSALSENHKYDDMANYCQQIMYNVLNKSCVGVWCCANELQRLSADETLA